MNREYINDIDAQIDELARHIDELVVECIDDHQQECCEIYTNDSAALIEVLHRFAKREWLSHKPEVRKACAAIGIDTLCDIFGWTDMEDE